MLTSNPPVGKGGEPRVGYPTPGKPVQYQQVFKNDGEALELSPQTESPHREPQGSP